MRAELREGGFRVGENADISTLLATPQSLTTLLELHLWVQYLLPG